MAKQKAKLSKADWEKLPDGERSNYVAIDNGAAYIPDIEPVDGWGLENIHGLKSAVDGLRREKGELERKLRDGTGDSNTAAELAAVKAELESLKKADPEGKANARVVEVEKTWRAQVDAVKAEAQKERDRLRAALDTRVRHQGLAEAFASKKARSERISALVALSQGRVRMVEQQDGNFEAQVFNADGQRAYSARPGKLSEYMGLDELAESYAKDMPEMFQGTSARGTGAENGAGGGSGSSGRFSMSKADAKANPNAYFAMKARAAEAHEQVALTD